YPAVMRSSLPLAWLLAALLLLSLISSVLLYVASAGARSQVALNELELDRLRSESDQARQRAERAEQALEQARHDATSRPAPTAAPAVTPTPAPTAIAATPVATAPTPEQPGADVDPGRLAQLQAIEQQVIQ